MATDPKELLIAWLNDAHAMENALISILENHAKDAKDNPAMQGRILRHIEETRRHAQVIKDCVARLGSSTSATKTAMAKVFGALQAPATGMFSDELIKNALTDFAAEEFEVASYKALVQAAEEMGHIDVAAACRQNLREDEDMARWIEGQIPMIVRETLQAKVTA